MHSIIQMKMLFLQLFTRAMIPERLAAKVHGVRIRPRQLFR